MTDSSLEAAVTQVLREHAWSDGFTSNCTCQDEAVWTHKDHREHLAAAVIEALPDVARLQAEIAAMRELLEAAEDTIDGEWGAGKRQPLDWLPDMEQIICRDSPSGHTPELRERRHYDTKVILGNAWVCARCEAFIRWDGDR